MSIGDIEVSNNTLKTAVGNLEINAWFQNTFLHHPTSSYVQLLRFWCRS
jgi:hypothetical protein